MKRKDIRDVRAEFGYTLRWRNGDGDDYGTQTETEFWLEDEYCYKNIPVEPSYIKHPTPHYRNGAEIYNIYLKLFEEMGIPPIDKKNAIKRYVQGISGINANTILESSERSNFLQGKMGLQKCKAIKDRLDSKLERIVNSYENTILSIQKENRS